MLQLLRNNNPFTLIILFIFALLIKLPALLHPALPLPAESAPAFNLLLNAIGFVVGGSAFGFTMLSVVMIFAQSLYLNAITTTHRIFAKHAFFPAFYYILITSFYPALNFFSPELFVNWFILFAFNMMLSFTLPLHPRKYIFNAGFLIAIASLFEFSALFFLLLALMAILLLRPFNLGELFVCLLGFLTVLYLYGSVAYLTDAWPSIPHWLRLRVTLPHRPGNIPYLIFVVSGCSVLLCTGLYGIEKQMSKSTIYVRRSWGVVLSYLLSALVVILFMAAASATDWLMIVPALSLIFAKPFYLEKNKLFINFIFYFSLLLYVVCQIALNTN